MTEEEWLSGTDVLQLVKRPGLVSNKRKYRLFGCGCCRQLGPWLNSPRAWKMIEASERYADRLIQEDALRRWDREAGRLRDAIKWKPGQVGFSPEWIALHAIAYVCTSDHYAGWGMVAEQLLRHKDSFSPEDHAALSSRFCWLLRDIFGNPFRPVAFVPAWRTSSAVGVAQRMYDARDFASMPILADALQDAGCEDADILAHCRGDGPHVRGCWVVDLVLGKS